MSLVDTIYDANNRSSTEQSLVDKLVEKAVDKSERNRPDKYSVYQLHIRGKEIWYGHQYLEESPQNVYLITEWEEKIPQPILFLFWSKLKEKLPILDSSYIQISDNLLWDKTNGEIINIKEEYESTPTTQKPESSKEDDETFSS